MLFWSFAMSENLDSKSHSECPHLTVQDSTPSIVHDICAVLEEKGLDECYIAEKMEVFENVDTNLRALAKSRFLDLEGRMMLAKRIKVTLTQLENFYEVSSMYS